MKRRNGSGRFSQGAASGEHMNPMDGAVNLADVTLLCACGKANFTVPPNELAALQAVFHRERTFSCGQPVRTACCLHKIFLL